MEDVKKDESIRKTAPIGEQSLARLVQAYDRRHGLTLQPMQVAELVYIFTTLVKENNFLLDQLNNEGSKQEIEGQSTLVEETVHASKEELFDEAEADGGYATPI